MTELLTREQLLKEVCMLCSIDNEQRDRPHREAIENHDAALRARIEALETVMEEVASMAGERWLEGQLRLAKVLKP